MLPTVKVLSADSNRSSFQVKKGIHGRLRLGLENLRLRFMNTLTVQRDRRYLDHQIGTKKHLSHFLLSGKIIKFHHPRLVPQWCL